MMVLVVVKEERIRGEGEEESGRCGGIRVWSASRCKREVFHQIPNEKSHGLY